MLSWKYRSFPPARVPFDGSRTLLWSRPNSQGGLLGATRKPCHGRTPAPSPKPDFRLYENRAKMAELFVRGRLDLPLSQARHRRARREKVRRSPSQKRCCTPFRHAGVTATRCSRHAGNELRARSSAAHGEVAIVSPSVSVGLHSAESAVSGRAGCKRLQ